MRNNGLVRVARALPALLLALVAACRCGPANPSESAPPPPPVTVAAPLVREVVDWDEYVGRFEAIESVEVKPRVSGYLQAVHFRDGDYVRAGQLLFTIDQRPAQAQLDQARAQLPGPKRLWSTRAPSLRGRERWRPTARRASRRSSSARRRCGPARRRSPRRRANVRAQGLNLGFTRVVAPISGRISQRRVDPGNAVTADETVLTTIVSTSIRSISPSTGRKRCCCATSGRAAAGSGSAVRIRLQDEADLHPCRPAGFRRQCDRSRFRHDPGPRRRSQSGRLPAARHDGPSAARRDAALSGAARTRQRHRHRRRPAPRPGRGPRGQCDGRPVELGPLVGNLRVIRSGLSPGTASSSTASSASCRARR